MPARGKTIVYFDNSNIFHGQRMVGWRIDAEKLHARLEKDGPIWQVYFFAAVSDPPRYSQTNFYRMLKDHLRWETVVFPLGSRTLHCNKCSSSWRTFSYQCRTKKRKTCCYPRRSPNKRLERTAEKRGRSAAGR